MPGILHVCTANQIRSPMAQLIMMAAMGVQLGDRRTDFPIKSAGLQAIVGEPLHPYAAAELDRRHIARDGFASTHFESHMATEAGLVLCATRLQRDIVVSRAPLALYRTFTLREMAYLMTGTSRDDIPGTEMAERVENIAELARRRRGYARGLGQQELDVDDPMGGPRSGYGRAAREIEIAVSAIVTVL